MKFISLLIAFVLYASGFTQTVENFDDGDFTTSPLWSGTNTGFVINSMGQLQTNSSIASTSYLTTPHNLADLNSKEWRFWIKLNFSPSASNFSKVYLTSANSDLTISPDGFYLLFGETGSIDAVRLYKQQNGVSTEICSGIAGQIAGSFAMGVRVVRDDTGNWNVSVDPGGGENFITSSTGFDSTALIGTYTGLICTYTVTNANKFYFDNFYIGNQIVDNSPPVLLSSSVVYSSQIDVLFDEPADSVSAQNPVNYLLNPAITITSATIDSSNPALVHLSLNQPLSNGTTYTLTTNTISDLAGNSSGNQSVNFTCLMADVPSFGDVIINEFMCDPSPSAGLPEVEFIEIYNKSNKYFNLQNWKIGDASSEGTVQQKWLSPGEYLVLCAVSSLPDYANGVGVTSFPSLNNTGDDIQLKDNDGIVIDQISYTDDWYLDEEKKTGGFSLERIKPNLPCSGVTNWKASNSLSGGTPGAVNTVNDLTLDTENPWIKTIDILSANEIQINFNEGMDSVSLSNSIITLSPALILQNRSVSSSFPGEMRVEFTENFVGSQQYTILLNSLSDCSMNTANVSGSFALAESPVQGDLIINEILFDPLTGGGDFVEIYNTSGKLIDLFNWSFANFDNDTIFNIRMLASHYDLKSNDYVVITKDSLFLKQNYPFTVPGKFIQSDLPSYTNDSSTVYLIFNDKVMDKVSYTKDWHFKLIEDSKGKSLERLDPKGLSDSPDNWHTASESIDFASPGGKNSQSFQSISTGDFDFTSKTISPDNDGFEDVLQIHYKMNQPDMVGTFTIYDDWGRLIRTVFKSELLATEGTCTWDGISNDSVKAVIGTYVAVFEAFVVGTGEMFTKTKAFVVAGKL